MRDGDDLVLSDRERRMLAELEAELAASDPEFDQRLGGHPGRAGPRRLWPGLVLLVLGAAAVLATFAISTWVAMVGVAMMAVGIGLLLPRLVVAAERAANRWGGSRRAG